MGVFLFFHASFLLRRKLNMSRRSRNNVFHFFKVWLGKVLFHLYAGYMYGFAIRGGCTAVWSKYIRKKQIESRLSVLSGQLSRIREAFLTLRKNRENFIVRTLESHRGGHCQGHRHSYFRLFILFSVFAVSLHIQNWNRETKVTSHFYLRFGRHTIVISFPSSLVAQIF